MESYTYTQNTQMESRKHRPILRYVLLGVLVLALLGVGVTAGQRFLPMLLQGGGENPDGQVLLAQEEQTTEPKEGVQAVILPPGPEKELPAYASLYPDLYAVAPDKHVCPTEVAYLTFDDGPSHQTEAILDTLKAEGIKATFFVTGKVNDVETLKRIAAEGHTIGLHTMRHDYDTLYESVDSYLADLNDLYTWVKAETGIEAEIVRIPGGSRNAYNSHISKEIISELLRRGFVYYDWNVNSGDNDPGVTQATIKDRIKAGMEGKDRLIVLFHDDGVNADTAKVLPDVISIIRDGGFDFQALDNAVTSVVFSYGD